MLQPGAVRQYVAAFAACFTMGVSGSCFGWVTPILGYLLRPDSEIPMTSSQSSWMVSIITIGNIFSSIPASYMADRWGRRPSILSTGPLFFISWAIILIWPSIETIYIARIIQGLSMGIVFTVVPTYLSEICSPNIRGSITSLYHNAWYLGHLIEYSLGSLLLYRPYTYATAILPIIFMSIFYWQPETPYFFLMKKKESEAATSLAKLRGSTELHSVDEELQSMIKSVNEEMENKASWKDVVRTSADRKSLHIVIGLGILRVLNGLIAIMTYSTQTFSQIGPKKSSDNSLISAIITPTNITVIYGAIMFLSSFFATLITDLAGRRQLLIISSLGASINLFLAGGYFFLYSHTDVSVSEYSWFPVVVIIVFSLFVTLGIGPVSVMYQSEMFLSNTRGFASSICAINITINGFIILKLYQVIDDSIGLYFNFWLFSVFCLIGTFWIYFIVPETKGKTFAQIREDLNASIQSKKLAKKKTPSISVIYDIRL